MAQTIIELGDWNDATPAAPAGRENVHMQVDRSGDIPKFSANVKPRSDGALQFRCDGNGSVPATGFKVSFVAPFSGTITGWSLISNANGNVQLDIKKSDFATFPATASIVGSAPPALAAARKATSTVLTGWTLNVVKDDVIELYITSIATITWFALKIQMTKSS